MLKTIRWQYLHKIVGLLLTILGIVGGKTILELYARQSIILPEEVFLYVPELFGLAYCLLILVFGIVLLGGWNWHKFPSIKILLIFAVINGILAICLGYLYGHSKISIDYERFAGENDLVWINLLIIAGICIVVFTWLPVFIQYYSERKNKYIQKMIISGTAFVMFCILLVGFAFPLFFDAISKTYQDHNLKVAIRQNVDNKFGFVSFSDLRKMINFDADKKMNTVSSGPDATPPKWTPIGPNMRTTILSFKSGEMANLEGIGECSNLETIDLGFNVWLQDVTPLQGLRHLTKLRMSTPNVKDITPIAELTQLTYLDLWGSLHLQDIKPLENLNNLSVFNAYGCNIQDVSPLKGLTNLSWLNLGGNKITDILPLVQNNGLGEGDKLDLRYNPLNDISVKVYIPQLRGRGVVVQWEPLKSN